MKSRTGAVIIDRHEARIVSPFEAKDAIKAIPGRRWDKTRKQWVVPAEYATEAERILWIYCDRVDVIDNREPTTAPPPPPPRRSENAFADALGAVPQRLRRRAFRALAEVLHPDHGGDLKAMQALNAAREVVAR